MLRVIDYYKYDWGKVFFKDIAKRKAYPTQLSSLISKINNQYLYWSKAKQYAQKASIDEKTLWAYIKESRNNERVIIPIIEEENINKFTFNTPNKFNELLFEIDQEYQTLSNKISNPEFQQFKRYSISSLMEEAIASSQIEGAATTREVAKEMLRTGRKPANYHEKMIVNGYVTIKNIKDDVNKNLSIEAVTLIHNNLINNTSDSLKDDDFKIREDDVEIENNFKVIYRAPKPETCVKSLKKLISYANNETEDFFIHPIIKAIIIHFWFAYIHPFYDGNGRTARILFSWNLMKKGYDLFDYIPLSMTIKKDRKNYENSFLYVEHDENDLNYFIFYNLKAILKAIKSFHQYIDTKNDEIKQIQKTLKDTKLNTRQLVLINNSIKKEKSMYTIKSHAECHDISRPIATKDLEGLVINKFFDKITENKQHYYVPVKNLRNIILKS
jgi:Fic family protein